MIITFYLPGHIKGQRPLPIESDLIPGIGDMVESYRVVGIEVENWMVTVRVVPVNAWRWDDETLKMFEEE